MSFIERIKKWIFHKGKDVPDKGIEIEITFGELVEMSRRPLPKKMPKQEWVKSEKKDPSKEEKMRTRVFLTFMTLADIYKHDFFMSRDQAERSAFKKLMQDPYNYQDRGVTLLMSTLPKQT